MAGHRDFANRLPKAELAATIALGGCSTAFADLRLGVVTWSVGILLSLNQARIEQRIRRELAPVRQLSAIVDLSEHCDIDGLRHTIDAYVAIHEPELSGLRDEIVEQAREQLVRLRNEKNSGELGTGEYYRWLLPRLARTSRGDQVHALSLMMSCEWDDSNEERRFIENNVSAAKRGVQIDRIFVMPRELLPEAYDNPAVRQHFRDQGPALLRGHFVDAVRLQRTDRGLAARLGSGFIAFDDRVALVDLHTEDGSARGMVTTAAPRLRELDLIFEQLLVLSEPLSVRLLAPARA